MTWKGGLMYIQILNFTSNFQDHLQAKNQQQIKSLYQSDPAPLYKTDAKNESLFSYQEKKKHLKCTTSVSSQAILLRHKSDSSAVYI